MSVINDECGCEQCGCHDEAPEPWEDGTASLFADQYVDDAEDDDDGELSEKGDLFVKVRGLLVDLDADVALDILSFVVADILTDYEEGEDRDDLLTDFIDKIDADVEFLDDLMAQEDDEEEASNATEWVSDILSALPVDVAAEVLAAVTEEVYERAIASEAE